MKLNEAKQILKNAGYLLEASRKRKGEEFFTAIETALKDNFENVELIKKLKSNSKAKYSFDTKEYHCKLELEFDYDEKGLDDGIVYAWLYLEDGHNFYDNFGNDEIDKIIKWIKSVKMKMSVKQILASKYHLNPTEVVLATIDEDGQIEEAANDGTVSSDVAESIYKKFMRSR